MVDYDNLWDVQGGTGFFGEGLDEATLKRCETKYGVKFPQSFVEAYRRRNGGILRDCESPEYLLPLFEDDTANSGQCIRPLTTYEERGEVVHDEDQLDWVHKEHGDPAHIFVLSTDGHVVYALNFNASGPSGEPNVVYIDFECCSDEKLADSFEAWIESLLPGEARPLVRWDDAELYDVIARETIRCDYQDGSGGEKVQQLLCESDDQLVLFTRTTTPQGKELEMVMLPKDIDSAWASIQPFRPEPCRTFTLHLQPRNLDDIQWTTSRRGSDGKWKNERSQGVPIYCTFESKDRAKLEKLRARLFGGKVPEKLLAEEERLRRYESMSQEQQRTAFAQDLLAHVQQMDQMFAAQEEDLGPVPDEWKLAMGNLGVLKQRMVEDLQRRAAGQTVEPAIEKQAQASKALPAPPGSSELSPEDEAFLSRYEAFSEQLVPILASVVDEATANAARPGLEAAAGEFAVLAREVGTRFESEENQARAMTVHMRIVPAVMRVHAQLYRIQNGVPDAGRHLYDVIQRLFVPAESGAAPPAAVTLSPVAQEIASTELRDPDSVAAKLVPKLNDLAGRLARSLRTVQDEASALAALGEIERLAGYYLARYAQWLETMRELPDTDIGILHARQGLARGEVKSEIARLRAWARPAYKVLRGVLKRLDEEAFL